MITLIETPTRIIVMGEEKPLAKLRTAFRYHPPDYFRADSYQLWKMTNGDRGWDGYRYPLALKTHTAGEILRGRKDEVLDYCKEYGYKVDTSKLLESPFADLTVEDLPDDLIEADFKLDKNQKGAVVEWLRHGIGVAHMAVNSGKTATFAAAAAMIKRKIPDARFLYFTFTERLVTQVFASMQAFLPGWHISQYGGGGKRDLTGADMVVATQAILNRNFTKLDRDGFFKSFIALLLDESHHCFPAGTLVDGRPIESVKVGDSVWSVNQKGNLEQKMVLRCQKHRVLKKLWRIRTASREVICTGSHPIFVNKAGFLRAGCIKPGMPVVLCTTGTIYTGEKLQGGYSESGPEDSSGSGWVRAQDQENCFFGIERVESVEVLEQRNSEEFRQVCPDGFVYNLEVEDNHTYFANDILVHNCQSPTAEKVLRACPSYFRLGASDSTKESDPDKWNKIKGLCGPIRYEVTSSELIASGRSAAPTLYLVDVKEWKNKFAGHSHEAEPKSQAWVLRDEEWVSAVYAGPVYEKDEEGNIKTKSKSRLENGSWVKDDVPITKPNLHLMRIGDRLHEVPARYVILDRRYDNAIIMFDDRNDMIVRWARYYSKQGKPTLVVATRTPHVLILDGLLQRALGDKVKRLFGDDTTSKRNEVFAWFKATPGAVLVTPLVKEGVSINELRAGVIADPVADHEVARQIIGRFMRQKETDNRCEITFFIDRQHPRLTANAQKLHAELSKIKGFTYYYPVQGPESLTTDAVEVFRL